MLAEVRRDRVGREVEVALAESLPREEAVVLVAVAAGLETALLVVMVGLVAVEVALVLAAPQQVETAASVVVAAAEYLLAVLAALALSFFSGRRVTDEIRMD